MIGTVINGKYRILSLLGAGGMDDVYKAEQLNARGQSFREVALKFLKPEFSREPTIARRFLRELEVMARLDHPHTVTVYDSGETEAGYLYFTMKLIPGETLKDILKRERTLPLDRALKIATQVCEALAAAHEQAEPVVHRDLKPANVFLEQQSGQEWVKVGDFGIAKVLGEAETLLTRTDSSLGTPLYMAPEQWPEYDKKKEVDVRTDLYALGIMLYEMLTGRRPFSGNTWELREQHLHAVPLSLPETIPANVRSLVERLLAKNPNDRPANAVVVKQELERALEPPAPLPPPPLPEPVNPPAPRPLYDKSHPQPKLEKSLRHSTSRNLFWIAAIILGLLFGIWLFLPTTKQATAPHSERLETPGPKETPRSQPPVAVATPPSPEKPTTSSDTQVGKDGREMVLVPAGEFFMGCNEKVDTECSDDEKPGRMVNLPAFAIDKTEVTVAAYRQCVAVKVCTSPDRGWACNWGVNGHENHPINCVEWNQAKTFCEWAGKRLPSEA